MPPSATSTMRGIGWHHDAAPWPQNSLWSQRGRALSCSERAFFESRLALVFYIYIYICIYIYIYVYIYIYRIIGCVYMIIIHHYIPRTYIIEKTLSPTQVRVPHQAVHSSQPFWSLVSEIDPSEAAVGILQCFPVEIVPGWDRTQLWVKSIRWNLTLWLWKKA